MQNISIIFENILHFICQTVSKMYETQKIHFYGHFGLFWFQLAKYPVYATVTSSYRCNNTRLGVEKSTRHRA